MATLRSFPVVVEEWGWDEALVGVRTADPEELAHAMKARLLAETGLTCAVGIGQTKLQAKTATGFAKPGGIAVLTRRTWIETMGHRPVTALWGIGTRTSTSLAELGIRTVAELARADQHELARRFGPRIGPHLKVLGLGGDDSPVDGAPHVPQSRSREETFEHDLTGSAEIDGHVARLAIEATESVVAEGRRVTHVAVKVRTAAFFTRTKISKLAEPTTDPSEVGAGGRSRARPLPAHPADPAARRPGGPGTTDQPDGVRSGISRGGRQQARWRRRGLPRRGRP